MNLDINHKKAHKKHQKSQAKAESLFTPGSWLRVAFRCFQLLQIMLKLLFIGKIKLFDIYENFTPKHTKKKNE